MNANTHFVFATKLIIAFVVFFGFAFEEARGGINSAGLSLSNGMYGVGETTELTSRSDNSTLGLRILRPE